MYLIRQEFERLINKISPYYLRMPFIFISMDKVFLNQQSGKCRLFLFKILKTRFIRNLHIIDNSKSSINIVSMPSLKKTAKLVECCFLLVSGKLDWLAGVQKVYTGRTGGIG